MTKANEPEPKVKKKELIEELLKKGMKAKQIVEELANRKPGVTITENYVSIVKGKMDGGTTKKSGKVKPAAPSFVQVMTILEMAGGVIAIEKAVKAIEAAKTSQELIDSLGGVDSARAIAAALSKK